MDISSYEQGFGESDQKLEKSLSHKVDAKESEQEISSSYCEPENIGMLTMGKHHTQEGGNGKQQQMLVESKVSYVCYSIVS